MQPSILYKCTWPYASLWPPAPSLLCHRFIVACINLGFSSRTCSCAYSCCPLCFNFLLSSDTLPHSSSTFSGSRITLRPAHCPSCQIVPSFLFSCAFAHTPYFVPVISRLSIQSLQLQKHLSFHIHTHQCLNLTHNYLLLPDLVLGLLNMAHPADPYCVLK